MSPGNPFIKTIATIPVSPKVIAHSIIAVDGDEPLDRAGDGVVKYESAHIDGVESELIVQQPALRHAGRAGDDRGGAPHPARALRALAVPPAAAVSGRNA